MIPWASAIPGVTNCNAEVKRARATSAHFVEHRVERCVQPAPASIGQDRRGRLAVELLQHECACNVEGAAAKRRVTELLSAHGAAGADRVEKRSLSLRVDEHDAGGRGHGGILHDAGDVDAAFGDDAHEEVAERIRTCLAEHGRAKAEPREHARGAEGGAAGAKHDRVGERERSGLRLRVDWTHDHVRDDDPGQTTSTGRHPQAMWISTSSATPPRIV